MPAIDTCPLPVTINRSMEEHTRQGILLRSLTRARLPCLPLAVLLATLNCGTTTREKPGEAGGEHPARPKPTIAVGRFLDERRMKGSAFDIPELPAESKLISNTDLGPQMAGAVASELTKLGAPVESYTDVPPKDAEYTVTGSISKLTRNEAVVRIRMNRLGAPALDREYVQRLDQLENPNQRLSRSRLQEILLAAYRDLARRVVRDIAVRIGSR